MSVEAKKIEKIDNGPPRMTLNELEQFYERVLRWHEKGTELNHAWFESDAKEYVRRKGYIFNLSKDKSGRSFYKVVKL
jgi:hypothetical protein